VSPCHDGHFTAANATVISGPPPAPLEEYLVAVEKDKICLEDA
jgi:Rieske Fe-S protein